MKTFLILIPLFLAYSSNSFSHEDHEDKKHDTVTVVGKDTIAINGIPINNAKTKEEKTGDHHLPGEKKTNFFGHLTEHLHNKLVHLPIGLVIAAFIITLLAFKREVLEPSIKVLIVIAALSTIAVYLTGTAQHEVFHNTPKEEVVNIHQTLGIFTAIFIWIWAIFLFVKSLKKYAWIIGAITLVTVLITGLYGGIVAHG